MGTDNFFSRDEKSRLPPSPTLREYKGVLHVHTAYSDASGRMPYVVECARKAGIDYVVVSDHGTLQAKREGWQGWHDGVLLVIGVEVSSHRGHALVLGLDQCRRWLRVHPDDYLPEVARLGGTAFIAHPERTHRGKLYRKRQAWPNLRTDAYAGIELWSYMHDWVEWAYPWRLAQSIRNPNAAIAGPHPDVLRSWDEVALRRRVAGVGALDAHERRFPFRRCRWSLFKMFPMDYLFGTVRTHVLLPEWSGDGAADVAALTGALASGRSFIAYDFLADATGTRFAARRGSEPVAMMGDEIKADGEIEFRATLPCEAEMALLRNSEPVASARANELVHRDSRPGVYRVEARLGNRPWVFTNHIFVR